MPKLDTNTILLVFVVITGLALLLQAIILLAIFITIRKAVTAVREEAEDLRSLIMPLIYDARDLLTSSQGVLANAQEFLTNAQEFVIRVTPKVETVIGNVTQITQTVREQTEQMHVSGVEMLERLRRQSARLDGMISDLLDSVDRAGSYLTNAVSKPVRQMSGILGTVKAVVESLRGSGARR